MRLVPVLIVPVLAAGLLWPVAAGAQRQGVTVDPDSPSGKEYALPIERARSQAAAGADEPAPAGATTSTSEEAPLFGVGIEPKATDPQRSRSKRDSGGRASEHPADARPLPGAVPVRPAAVGAAGGGSSLWPVIGLAAVLMLGGGAIGAAVRRR